MPTTVPMEAQTIRKYSTWFTIYGLALIVIGALAILAPGIATLATSILVGWLLLASGIFGIVAVISTGRNQTGFWWHLLTTALYIVAGVTLLWNPIAAAVTLTIVLAAYLLATGAMKIIVAFGYRDAIPGAWLWMLLSAVIDIVWPHYRCRAAGHRRLADRADRRNQPALHRRRTDGGGHTTAVACLPRKRRPEIRTRTKSPGFGESKPGRRGVCGHFAKSNATSHTITARVSCQRWRIATSSLTNACVFPRGPRHIVAAIVAPATGAR